MHETVLAQNLLAAILAEVAKHNAKPLAAKISCGQLSAVNDQALCFAFEAVAKDTPCQTTKLIIEHKPLQAACSRCSRTFDITLHTRRNLSQNTECHSERSEESPPSMTLTSSTKRQTQADRQGLVSKCPHCSSSDFQLLPDAPLMLEEIEFDRDQ